MLDKQTATKLLSAILGTLAEVESGTPESNLYIICGMDMDIWHRIRGIMLDSDWVSIKNHFVTLTPKGRELGERVNRILAQQK